MRRYCTVAGALGIAFALPATAHAAQFTVTAPTDTALRAAVNAANDAEGPDEVLLAGHTVVLTQGDLDVLDDLVLRGPGVIDGSQLESDSILEVRAPLTIDDVQMINTPDDAAVLVLAPTDVRVERSQFASNEGAIAFYPDVETEALRAEDASLTVSDSTFEGNVAATGGAIDVSPGSSIDAAVMVARSTFTGNRAVGGGDVSARGGAINIWDGMLTVENSTFSGNVVQGQTFGSGGGAIAVGNASATLTHVTITGNLAEHGARGGGIAGPRFDVVGSAKALSFVPVMVTNSIVAGNTSEVPEGAFAAAAVRTDDCDFQVGTTGGNLESGTTCGFRDARDKQNADPKLAALAANGGPTRTHALAADSPAVNMAVAGRCLATDQRSIPRMAAACDSGAYELVPASTQPVSQQPSAGGALGEEASSCLSVRRFKIRLRVPRGEEVRKATVTLNGEKIRVKRGQRLTAVIDLRGLTKKRYKVQITLHLKGGDKVTGVRRYWTCTPAIRWTKPPKV